MKKGQVPKKQCISCGKWMKPVKDRITKTYTGHLWKCDCFPKDVVLSR